MADSFSWYGADVESGKVVSKTDVHSDGSINRYEYTEPDCIEAGHGDKWYNDMNDYLNDNPAGSRDKNDPKSIDRPWYGNGYDISLIELKSMREFLINEKINTTEKILIKKKANK